VSRTDDHALIRVIEGPHRRTGPSIFVRITIRASAVDEAADGLAGDDPEEDLDHVQPGAVGGDEVQGDPRIALQPVLDLGVFVGGAVVADEVQLLPGVGLGELFQEAQELLVAVAGVADVGYFAGGDLQRGEQRGGAMAFVVMGLALGDARA
jgi:hypothetical protein